MKKFSFLKTFLLAFILMFSAAAFADGEKGDTPPPPPPPPPVIEQPVKGKINIRDLPPTNQKRGSWGG